MERGTASMANRINELSAGGMFTVYVRLNIGRSNMASVGDGGSVQRNERNDSNLRLKAFKALRVAEASKFLPQ